MQVKIIEQSLGLMVVPNQMLHTVDRRLPVVTDQIVSIQVVPFGIKSIKTFLNPIRVQHRHYDHLEMLSNEFSFRVRTQQKFDDALSCPARPNLSRVDPGADEDDWFGTERARLA